MTKKNAPSPAKKYKKAPDAPRRFKSSYMFFSIEKHRLIREEMAAVGSTKKPDTTKVAKLVSQAWKNLSHEEREVFEAMARKDKERYEREKNSYKGPWKVLDKKPPRKKDPNAPKRPMSAFLDFSNSKRSLVKMQHGGELSNADLSRKLAQMWKDASEEEKKVYVDREAGLRKQYKIAMDKWKKDPDITVKVATEETKTPDRKVAMPTAGVQSSNQSPHAGFFPSGLQQQNQFLSPPCSHQYQSQAFSPPFASLATNSHVNNAGPDGFQPQTAAEAPGMRNQLSSYTNLSVNGSGQRIIDNFPHVSTNPNVHNESRRTLPTDPQLHNLINVSPIAATHGDSSTNYYDDQPCSLEPVAPQRQPNARDSRTERNSVAGFQGALATSPLFRGQTSQPDGYARRSFQQSHQENQQFGQWLGGQDQGHYFNTAPPFRHQQDQHENSQYEHSFGSVDW